MPFRGFRLCYMYGIAQLTCLLLACVCMCECVPSVWQCTAPEAPALVSLFHSVACCSPSSVFMATCQICTNPQDEDAMLPVALPFSLFLFCTLCFHSSLSLCAFPFFFFTLSVLLWKSDLCLTLCPCNRVFLTNRDCVWQCCKARSV